MKQTKIIITALIDGQWIILPFDTSDPRWRETVQQYRECGKQFKLTYK